MPFILVAKVGSKRPTIALFDGCWKVGVDDCYKSTIYRDSEAANHAAKIATQGNVGLINYSDKNNPHVEVLEISDDLANRINGTRFPVYPAPSLGAAETTRRVELAEAIGEELKSLALKM